MLVQQIANELGVARETISRQLSSDPEYQAAITEALDARLEQVEIDLDELPDDASMVTLARVKERLSHARWRAERLNPSRYGQRPMVAVQINSGASMTDADLERIARRTVEGGE